LLNILLRDATRSEIRVETLYYRQKVLNCFPLRSSTVQHWFVDNINILLLFALLPNSATFFNLQNHSPLPQVSTILEMSTRSISSIETSSFTKGLLIVHARNLIKDVASQISVLTSQYVLFAEDQCISNDLRRPKKPSQAISWLASHGSCPTALHASPSAICFQSLVILPTEGDHPVSNPRSAELAPLCLHPL